MRVVHIQIGFAQNSSTPAASLCGAPARTLLVAKATRPWTPPIARACIPAQGAAGVALAKFPGYQSCLTARSAGRAAAPRALNAAVARPASQVAPASNARRAQGTLMSIVQ